MYVFVDGIYVLRTQVI